MKFSFVYSSRYIVNTVCFKLNILSKLASCYFHYLLLGECSSHSNRHCEWKYFIDKHWDGLHVP